MWNLSLLFICGSMVNLFVICNGVKVERNIRKERKSRLLILSTFYLGSIASWLAICMGISMKEKEIKKPLIQLEHISKVYQVGDTQVKANDKISLEIERGEFVAIVGKSGSGKSTIMNIIGALDVPTNGKYILNGTDVSSMKEDALAEIRNKTIGFIFQQYNLLPRQNLLENVELPLLYSGENKRKRREQAMAALKRVGIEDKWRNMPSQLSGGQQQRASIARALAGNPSLILADEPTGALDSKTSKEVLDFLKTLNEEGNTIVLITHDNTVAMCAKRVINIYDGKIIFDGTSEEYEKQGGEKVEYTTSI